MLGLDSVAASGDAKPTEPDSEDFHLFHHILLREFLANTLDQKANAAVFRQVVNVESHTLSCIDRSQHPNRGLEAVGSLKYKDD